MQEMESYVLYDPETRELLGGYIQVPPPEHVYRIPCSDYEREFWVYYKLNDDMTGIVRWWFEEQPEDPPVDPDPEEPVQSGN
jgi:hypothetical protein